MDHIFAWPCRAAADDMCALYGPMYTAHVAAHHFHTLPPAAANNMWCCVAVTMMKPTLLYHEMVLAV